jgi:hypothetical protein
MNEFTLLDIYKSLDTHKTLDLKLDESNNLLIVSIEDFDSELEILLSNQDEMSELIKFLSTQVHFMKQSLKLIEHDEYEVYVSDSIHFSGSIELRKYLSEDKKSFKEYELHFSSKPEEEVDLYITKTKYVGKVKKTSNVELEHFIQFKDLLKTIEDLESVL